MKAIKILVAISIVVCTINTPGASAGLIESERMEEYHRRGHTWPPNPQDYTPNTPGWQTLNERRFKQLSHVDDTSGERYESHMAIVHSALQCRNFTEYGWGVTKAPQAVVDKLKKRLHDGLKNENKKQERSDVCQETDADPFFINDDKMNQEILNELLPLHEAWAGVELVPNNAYGLRVYRNGTNLLMHLDKMQTHVISSILHVDHGENDEPWPIVIEDFHGNTNEVYLESGDMFFYESSKCVHGRPTKMKGEYYSSLFSHYYPTDWNTQEIGLDIHYRIPSTDVWYKPVAREEGDDTDEMVLVSLCMKEPGCEDAWCGLKDAVKWYGPAPGYGKVLSGGGYDEVADLQGIPAEESFEMKVFGKQDMEDEL